MSNVYRLLTGLLVGCLVVVTTQLVNAEHNWPGWRGPDATGHSAEKNLPVKWSENDVVWRTEIEGRGQSSPVIWGERIFLTSALENGRQRIVLCVDRNKGNVLWRHVAWTGQPEKSHNMNQWASPTCATDGQRVIAFFGKGGLHCYDVDGKHQWSKDLGDFPGSWGTGASPVIVGEKVIQNCDAAGKSFLVAFDKQTGEELWRTPRKATPRGGWSTPILVDNGDRQELVLNGEFGVQAYDAENGKELWSCKSFNGRGTPTPVFTSGLICVVNGKSGDVYAIRPGGSGDVTKSQMAWHTPRGGTRDLPSPIVVGDQLVVISLRPGIATSYDVKTGKELSKERLQGNFAASPVAAGGLIYFPSESGDIYVARPGAKFEVVARNRVGSSDEEIFRASITPSDGQLFCRSDRVLYCVGVRRSAAGN